LATKIPKAGVTLGLPEIKVRAEIKAGEMLRESQWTLG